MLEVIAVIFLSKKIGGIAQKKGHSRGLFITLTAIAWIVCEIGGAIVGLIVFEGETLPMYVLAIFGAVMGVLLVFLIAKGLGNKHNLSQEVIDQ